MEPEDINLIVLFFEDVKSKYLGKETAATKKMDELLEKFKNALLLSDKRIMKLMGKK